MAFATPEAFREIIVRLSVLRYVITSNTRRGKFDIATDAEDFFAGFLNRLLGWNLQNLNIIEHANYPAIDLGDQEHRISVQVTAENTLIKIRDTIDSFYNQGHRSNYDRLIILILSRKLQHKTEIDTLKRDLVRLDVWDIDDILEIVEHNLKLEDYTNNKDNLYDRLEDYTRRELPSIVRHLSTFEKDANGNYNHGLLRGLELVVGHPPESASSFLSACFPRHNNEEKTIALEEIIQLYNLLKDQSYIGTRQILAHAVQYSITAKEFNWRYPNYEGNLVGEQSLIYYPGNIAQSMSYPAKLHFYERVEGLRFLGWSEPLEDWPKFQTIRLYLHSSESNLFFLLKQFFNNNAEKLRSVLVDLDFRHLD